MKHWNKGWLGAIIYHSLNIFYLNFHELNRENLNYSKPSNTKEISICAYHTEFQGLLSSTLIIVEMKIIRKVTFSQEKKWFPFVILTYSFIISKHWLFSFNSFFSWGCATSWSTSSEAFNLRACGTGFTKNFASP